jgi:UDP-N-acetylglucosamine 2-epimerase (non-hydrolysing)
MTRAAQTRVIHVVGARPNFMKMAPVYFAMAERPELSQLLVHTGQHYDEKMSDIFFHQLGLPQPDMNLGVGSGSHAVQTAQTMVGFESVVLDQKPDWLCVYGDVNSTVACALVAAKLGVKVAHVEAGLRSRDWSMPEEINRVVTDRISDLLLTPSADADENLRAEGVDPERIVMVGNCMIDTLVRLLPLAEAPKSGDWDRPFVLVTLHRPSNVDEADMLGRIAAELKKLAEHVRVVFPIHPRTRARLDALGIELNHPNVELLEPLGYLQFLWLQQQALAVVTDSGGIQEETTYLGTACLTLRDNTERPITCELGTNTLLGREPEKIVSEVQRAMADRQRTELAVGQRVPPLWEGAAGKRVAETIALRSRGTG